MNQPLSGGPPSRSLAALVQFPGLHKQLMTLKRELNTLPPESPAFCQKLAEVTAMTEKVRKAKAADDLLIQQALVNTGGRFHQDSQ